MTCPVLLALVLTLPHQPKAPCTHELLELFPHGLASERSHVTPLKRLLRKTDEPGERIGARIADELKHARRFADSGSTTNVVDSGPSTCGLVSTRQCVAVP